MFHSATATGGRLAGWEGCFTPWGHLRSVRRKLLSSWKRAKPSQESGGCTCRAVSMSTVYRDQKVSACSAMTSGHQEKAWEKRRWGSEWSRRSKAPRAGCDSGGERAWVGGTWSCRQRDLGPIREAALQITLEQPQESRLFHKVNAKTNHIYWEQHGKMTYIDGEIQ